MDPRYQQAPQNYSAPKPVNGFAITALVLGLLGLPLGLVMGLVALVFAPLAIVFGAIGIGFANKHGSGKGLAIAGLVLGIVSLVAILALVLLFLR